MERKGEWLELRLKQERSELWEAYVQDKIGIPAVIFRKMIQNKEIVKIGDRIRLRFFAVRPAGFPAQYHSLELLYEDDFCLIANKPAGMTVHPSYEGQMGTLANAVAFHYEATGQQVAVRHIHRLDEWTSGPVLYAKNEFAQYKLDEDMRHKRIERIYTAIVRGIPRLDSGIIDASIGRDRHTAGKRRVSPSGDHAVTHYKVLEKYKDTSLLQLRLETGRTHQIRVHLSYLGHPILGDEMYGGADNRINRQALHGRSLIFRHPLTAEEVKVEVDLPEDIMHLIGLLQD